MTLRWQYDTRFAFPAPIVDLEIGRPGGTETLKVRGQVDSGADATVLPESIVRVLGLQRTGQALVRGVVGPGERRPLYRAVVALVGGETTVLTRVLAWDSDYGLLGRDLLNRWRVLLDGPGQEVEVTGG